MIMGFTEAFRMFGDIWDVYKKYAARNLSDEEIEIFIADLSSIHQRYQTPFSLDVCLALSTELERSIKHFEKEKRRKEL